MKLKQQQQYLQNSNNSFNLNNLSQSILSEPSKHSISNSNYTQSLNNSINLLDISYQDQRTKNNEKFVFNKSFVYEPQRQYNNRYARIKKLMASKGISKKNSYYILKNSDPKIATNKQDFEKYIQYIKNNKKKSQTMYINLMTNNPLKNNQAFKKKPQHSQIPQTKQKIKPLFPNAFDYDNQLTGTFGSKIDAKQAYQFIDTLSSNRQRKLTTDSKNSKQKNLLQPIRQQKSTPLQISIEQQRFVNLLKDFQNLQNNFTNYITDFQTTKDAEKIDQKLKKIDQQCRRDSLKKKNQQLQYSSVRQSSIRQKNTFYQQVNKKINQIQEQIKQAGKQSIVSSKGIQKSKYKIQNILQISYNSSNRYYQQSNQQDNKKSINRSQDKNKRNQFEGHLQRTINKIDDNFKIVSLVSPFHVSYLPPNKIHQNTRLYHSIANDNNNINNDKQAYRDIIHTPKYKNYEKDNYQMKSKSANPTPRNKIQSINESQQNYIFSNTQMSVIATFIKTQQQIKPIKSIIKFTNKCNFQLQDIFVIVYGQIGVNLQVTPRRVFFNILKENQQRQCQVLINQECICQGNFNIQITYRRSGIRKKIAEKIIIPFTSLIQFFQIQQIQFHKIWKNLADQIYIPPRKIEINQIRWHKQIQRLLPLIQINQDNFQLYSYGTIFSHLSYPGLIILKIQASKGGKISFRLKTQNVLPQKIQQTILDSLNKLLFEYQ